MHDEALKRQADERRRAERKLRHMQDDLRYAMKKLADPIDVNMGYEEVRIFRTFVSPSSLKLTSSRHRRFPLLNTFPSIKLWMTKAAALPFPSSPNARRYAISCLFSTLTVLRLIAMPSRNDCANYRKTEGPLPVANGKNQSLTENPNVSAKGPANASASASPSRRKRKKRRRRRTVVQNVNVTGTVGVTTETAARESVIAILTGATATAAASGNESGNGSMIRESGIGRRGMGIIRVRMMIIGRRGSMGGRVRGIGRGREIGIGILGGIIGIGIRRGRGMRDIGRGGRGRVSTIGSMLLRETISGGGRGIR